MTQGQAELAAGTTLVMYGDGYSGPASGPWASLLGLTRLEVYGLGTDAHPFSSLVASGGPGDRPTVATPQGVSLGDTVQKLTATYGATLHYYPANPAGGFDPSPGYVADTPQGSLSFWATNGVVDQIATGQTAASGERVG